MALLAAVGAAIAWGLADFLGGRQTRVLPARTVALLGRVAALLALIPIAVLLGQRPTSNETRWALLAGLIGPVALLYLYRALSNGAMTLVAPLIGAGATVLPVLSALLAGDRPTRLQLAGMILAALGVALVCLSRAHDHAPVPGLRAAVLAAIFIGCSFVAFQRAGAAPGDAPVGVVLVATLTNVVVLSAMAWRRRSFPAVPRRARVTVLAVGTCDAAASVFYTYASGAGNAAITASVGASFPVITALLAFTLLRERPTRHQMLGVAAVILALPMLASH